MEITVFCLLSCFYIIFFSHSVDCILLSGPWKVSSLWRFCSVERRKEAECARCGKGTDVIASRFEFSCRYFLYSPEIVICSHCLVFSIRSLAMVCGNGKLTPHFRTAPYVNILSLQSSLIIEGDLASKSNIYFFSICWNGYAFFWWCPQMVIYFWWCCRQLSPSSRRRSMLFQTLCWMRRSQGPHPNQEILLQAYEINCRLHMIRKSERLCTPDVRSVLIFYLP